MADNKINAFTDVNTTSNQAAYPEENLQMVVGFLVQRNLHLVAMVRKQCCKPGLEWMDGRLNGIGGKIEEGETPLQAMRREFLEETERAIINWRLFCLLTGKQVRAQRANARFTVYFFVSFVDAMPALRSCTKEQVLVESIHNLNSSNCIANVPWLLRMALDIEDDAAQYFQIEERYVASVAQALVETSI